MSKLIRKILKNSIIPASFMIVGKLAGLAIAVSLFKLDIYSSNNTEGLFTFQLYFLDIKSTQIANSFSDMLMMLPLLIGVIILNLKEYFYRKSQTDFKTLTKLTTFNMLNWITGKGNNFIQTFCWTFFFWISCLLAIKNIVTAQSFSWIGGIAFMLVITTAWSIIKTFEFETDKIYPSKSFA